MTELEGKNSHAVTQHKKYDFGFVTMTFDMCHQGHFDLLRFCKQRCNFLTVGLTTDERAQVEKRVTILSYDQREAILKACKYVDEVIANFGTAKETMYKTLYFDVLFSGDDYVDSAEFCAFRKACPHVPVVFLPRQKKRCSTVLIDDLFKRFYNSQKIIAGSVYGHITRQGFGKPFWITKNIAYSPLESTNDLETRDVLGFYRFFDELPRNWKRVDANNTTGGEKKSFPLISGIHPNRELVINRALKKQPWCTYLSDHIIYQRDDESSAQLLDSARMPDQFATLQEFANHVVSERQTSFKIVQLVQRDAGVTLEEWCRDETHSIEDLTKIINDVEQTIIPFLKANQIVHGDIHPRNVIVQPNTLQVSLIDFGWVSSLKFDLSKRERIAVQQWLQEDFDLQHFRQSLVFTPSVVRLQTPVVLNNLQDI